MSPLDAAAPAAGLTRRFNEPDRFASALFGGQFDYLPMRGEPFAATLRVLRVGEMVVQQADTSSHIARGGISPGMAVLLLYQERPRDPVRMNGAEVGIAEAVLAAGGAELAACNTRPLSWAALALPLSLLEALAEIAPPPLRVEGTVGVVVPPPDRLARLGATLAAASRMAEDLPAELGRPGTAEGLAKALREEVAAALTAEAEHRPRPRAAREAMRLVQAAEACMEAQVSRPIYTEELCLALGVSPRRLHDAFRAVLAMSPHAYLKSRRLMLVRRALLQQRPGPNLVKSAALSHGFWHLGHFARDYRALFGELPSETIGSA